MPEGYPPLSAPEAAAGCFLMRMSLALALVHGQAGEEVSGSRQRLDGFKGPIYCCEEIQESRQRLDDF